MAGKRAGKVLNKIRKTDKSLYRKMNTTIEFIGEVKKGDLKGYFCVDLNHLGTNYELCYTLEEDEDGQLVLIILMGPRENFYPELKRYLSII